MSVTLRDLLVSRGYIDLGYDGVSRVMIRPRGTPLCLCVVEDWPMDLIFRSARGARTVSRPPGQGYVRPPARAVVRRPDDLAAIGEAMLREDGSIEPSLACQGTWCLADTLTPLGLELPFYVGSVLLSVKPYLVRLVRLYTSPISAVLLEITNVRGLPVLGPVFDDINPPGRIDLALRLGAISSPRKPEVDEVVIRLRPLSGAGC
ncbi:MAG: hypothetical protein ACP5HK_00635 [Acidilobus sp.]